MSFKKKKVFIFIPIQRELSIIMKILVTGAAGFIGFHLVKNLLERGEDVVGIDNLSDYYDVNLKYGRLAVDGIDQESILSNQKIQSSVYPNYHFVKLDICDRERLHTLFDAEKFDVVCHLAAQAGVRYSIDHPFSYIDTNLSGFGNVLEFSRQYKISHFVYASSSSVYGLNEKYPFSVHDGVNHPVSLYAASKKANELMAHSYSHLYGLSTTGLRFFTVYGPWGRPDMSPILFADAIAHHRPIKVYNYGKMMRDFTYIDDTVDGVIKAIYHPAKPSGDWDAQQPDPCLSSAPYRIYNIGNSAPVELMTYIEAIENELGIEAVKEYLPMQPGDVLKTFSDISDSEKMLGFLPATTLETGVKKFIDWYKCWYKLDFK